MAPKKLPRILTDKRVQLGPYPMEKLKRVAQPTNLLTDKIQRIDQRQVAPSRASRGEFGPAVQKASERMKERDPITEAVSEVLRHIGSPTRHEASAVKAPVSADPLIITNHLKSFGYFLKADVMGVCELPQSAIYSHDRNGQPVNLDYKYALVIVVGKDHRTVRASGGHDYIADALSMQAYVRLSTIAEVLSNYIRRLGYDAMPQSTGAGFKVLIPPLLLHAGIGEASRIGIILNPFLGPSLKGAAVLTNMPLVPDKPIDFGLQDFCRKKCAQVCPSKAISTGERVMYNGYQTWKVNDVKCCSFVLSNKHGYWCNTCIKSCPWTQPNTWPHQMVRWAASRSSLARTLAIQGDRLFGHTKGDESEKWWFDLGYRDGVLEIPALSRRLKMNPPDLTAGPDTSPNSR